MTIGSDKVLLDSASPKCGKPLGAFYTDSFYEEQSGNSLRSARAILGRVFQMAAITTVLDVGCGVGPWLRVALDLGAEKVIGVDGDYVNRDQLMIDHAHFRARNLEDRLELEPGDPETFDLVISLEVAEHISADNARTFVSNLVAHGDLVLFSAAIPGQGGVNHINEQWPGYWTDIFSAKGFDCFDVVRAEIWDDASIEWWYAQNVLIYARRGSLSHRLMADRTNSMRLPLALVHPKKLEHAHFSAAQEQVAAKERILLLEAQLHQSEDQREQTKTLLAHTTARLERELLEVRKTLARERSSYGFHLAQTHRRCSLQERELEDLRRRQASFAEEHELLTTELENRRHQQEALRHWRPFKVASGVRNLAWRVRALLTFGRDRLVLSLANDAAVHLARIAINGGNTVPEHLYRVSARARLEQPVAGPGVVLRGGAIAVYGARSWTLEFGALPSDAGITAIWNGKHWNLTAASINAEGGVIDVARLMKKGQSE